MSQVLSLVQRTHLGTGDARALRRAGYVPAVVYGLGQSPAHVAVKALDFDKERKKKGLRTRLFQLTWDNGGDEVIVKDVQYHPVHGRPQHIDFERVDRDSRVMVLVPVVTQNAHASPGLKRGGVLHVILHAIEVSCVPYNIPAEMVVDLTGFQMGQNLHVHDLAFPEGVVPTARHAHETVLIVGAPSGSADGDDGKGSS